MCCILSRNGYLRYFTEKERQQSTLSIYSTPASENQTLPENLSVHSALPTSESRIVSGEVQPPDVETKQELIDEAVLGHEPMLVETGPATVPSHGPSDVDAEVDADADADGEIDDGTNANATVEDGGAIVDAIGEDNVEGEKDPAIITGANVDVDAGIDADVEEGSPVAEPAPTRTRADRRRDRPPPIIIEELDTPATRRAKSMAKKQQRLEALAEQQRLANLEQGRAPSPEIAASPEIVASPPKKPVQVKRGRGRPRKTVQLVTAIDTEMKSEPDSELSPLSSIAEVVEVKTTKTKKGKQVDEGEAGETVAEASNEIIDEDMRKWKRVSADDAHELGKTMQKGPGELHLRDDEFLEGGTLVWAKVGEHVIHIFSINTVLKIRGNFQSPTLGGPPSSTRRMTRLSPTRFLT